MRAADVDIDLFRSLERALQQPAVRASRTAVAVLLANDFIEFGCSGRVYDKAMVIDALANEPAAEGDPLPEMRDFAVKVLAADTVLVTYRSGDDGDREVLRSSLWVQTEGNWQMLFHQGTVAAR